MKKIFLVYLVCIAFCSCEKDDTNKRNGNEKTSCVCFYNAISFDTIQWGNANLNEILTEWIFDAFVDTAICKIVTAENVPEMTLKFLENSHVSGSMIGGIDYRPNDEQYNTPTNEDIYNQYVFVDGEIIFSNIEPTHVFNSDLNSKIFLSLQDTNKVFVTKDKLFLMSNGVLIFTKNIKNTIDQPLSLYGDWREIMYGKEISRLTFSDNDTLYYQSGNIVNKSIYSFLTKDTLQIYQLEENEKSICPIIVHNNDCITIKRFYKSDAAVYPPTYKEIFLFRVK